MILLSFETVTLLITFLFLSRVFKGFLSWTFPLQGALYVVPFNKVDDQKVPGPAIKKPKKDKKSEIADPLIDYQLGAVMANYKNFQNHDGMGDYEFICILLTTSTIAILCKLLLMYVKDYFPNQILRGFFEDQNIDAYLLAFIIFCYLSVLWKNLFGMPSMKVHRQHCFYMAFAAVIVCMFNSLGYGKFYIGKPKEAVYSFNVGVTALISSVLKSENIKGNSEFLSFNGFSWIVTGTTCLIVFLCAPSIIKFVDAFQVYRKAVREYEEAADNVSLDLDTIKTNKRLLKQYQIGGYLQILVLIAETIALALHVRVVNEYFFQNDAKLGEFCLAGFMALALMTEAFTTHKELKDRSHHITEMLVRYKPKTKLHKDLFVGRCHQIYKESVRHMLHAMSRSIIPLILLLMVFIALKKKHTSGIPELGSELSLKTLTEPNLTKVLQQLYTCPLERPRMVISVTKNYGICMGIEAIDLHSKTPFTLTSGMNIGQHLTEAMINFFRLMLLNVTLCKYIFTIGYIFIVLTTNEEIE